jgi:hypothetical protein
MIEAVIAGILAKHCVVIESRVKARWSAQSSIEGIKEIHSDIKPFIGNLVIAEINATGMGAWISEFGRGSNMEDAQDNPYLNEYLRGDNFNQWRLHSSRIPIMGRSEGEYKDLDGKTQYSSGKMQGMDLERDGDPRFKPLMPQHIIREEVTQAIPELIESIQEAVRDFAVKELTMTTQIYL